MAGGGGSRVGAFYNFLYVWNVLKSKTLKRKRKGLRQGGQGRTTHRKWHQRNQGERWHCPTLQGQPLPKGLRGCTSSGSQEWWGRKPTCWSPGSANSWVKSGYAREPHGWYLRGRQHRRQPFCPIWEHLDLVSIGSGKQIWSKGRTAATRDGKEGGWWRSDVALQRLRGGVGRGWRCRCQASNWRTRVQQTLLWTTQSTLDSERGTGPKSRKTLGVANLFTWALEVGRSVAKNTATKCAISQDSSQGSP